MKQLGRVVCVLLLLVVWSVCCFVATAQLTADQSVQPSTVAVGQTATVNLMLTYSGNNGIQVTVSPGFTPGITVGSGPQNWLLSPGMPQPISYPIIAEQSGSYWITTLISYMDEGGPRQLSKESPFNVISGGGQRGQYGSGESKPLDVKPPIQEPARPADVGIESPSSINAPPSINAPEQPANISPATGNGSV
jgi:hypothetical protein